MTLCLNGFYVYLVPFDVHATLQQRTSVSVETKESLHFTTTSESEVVLQYNDIMRTDDPRKERLKLLLAELGQTEIPLCTRHCIACYFIGSSREQLMQLRKQYESGDMKNVLEDIFTLLVNADEKIIISRLDWDSDKYSQSMQQLLELKAQGQCPINKLPVTFIRTY